jgi:hypothetical protein
VLIKRPRQTARLERTRAVKPAARLVIQNKCGAGFVCMDLRIVADR